MVGPIRSNSPNDTPVVADEECYKEKRKRNNTAVKRSREKAREHNKGMKEKVAKLKNANNCLEAECQKLEEHLKQMKELFLETANSTSPVISGGQLEEYLNQIPSRPSSAVIDEIMKSLEK